MVARKFPLTGRVWAHHTCCQANSKLRSRGPVTWEMLASQNLSDLKEKEVSKLFLSMTTLLGKESRAMILERHVVICPMTYPENLLSSRHLFYYGFNKIFLRGLLHATHCPWPWPQRVAHGYEADT